MQDLIDLLLERKKAISQHMKLLEQSIREFQNLEYELRHVDALLAIHNSTAQQLDTITGQNSDIPLVFSDTTKKPSGIARHIMAVFFDNDIPLPIHEIDTQLKARCIEATPSGINAALRRNPDYFEQVERGKWQLKRRSTPTTGKQEQNKKHEEHEREVAFVG